jgi:mannosyltransferase
MRAAEKAGLLALVALGAALRFGGIDAQSFGHDEAVTAGRIIQPSLFDTLSIIPDSESTPPLYYLLAWGWSKVFGTGEAGLRSLSALVGTATVPVAYGIGRKLASNRVALVLAALVAVNPMFVWYSQEARAYSLLLFLSALSLLFLLEALESPSRKRLAGWTVASALALATHYFAAFLVVPEAVWLLWRLRGDRSVSVAVIATTVAGAALLPLAAHQAADGRVDWIGETPVDERLLTMLKTFLVGEEAVDFHSAFPAALVLVAYVGAALAGTGLAAMLALALAGRDYLLHRNLLPVLLPLTLTLAAGLGARRAGRTGIAATAALCALSSSLVVRTTEEPILQRADWRGAADAIGRTDGPRVIVAPGNGDDPLLFYIPSALRLTGGRAPASEVVVVAYLTPEGVAAELPDGFRPIQRHRVGRFGVVKFRAPRPVPVAWQALARSDVGAGPQGSPAILVDG